MNQGLRTLLSILCGGAVFALVYIVLAPGSLVLAIPSALLGILVARGLVKVPRKGPGELLADGTARLDWEQALKDGRARHRVLVNEAFKIQDMKARKKVDEVADLVKKILDDIKDDPSDLRPARQFLNYYLDATVKIVQRYVELYGKGGSQPEIQASLRRVEETLDTIKAAFEKQLAILLENDKLDLDTELTVLRRTIDLEGLGPDPAKINTEETHV